MLAMDSPTILVGLTGWHDASMASSTKNYRNREQDQKLRIEIWNVTSLTGKEPKLVEETIRCRLDIVGVLSTKRKGTGTLILNKR